MLEAINPICLGRVFYVLSKIIIVYDICKLNNDLFWKILQ